MMFPVSSATSTVDCGLVVRYQCYVGLVFVVYVMWLICACFTGVVEMCSLVVAFCVAGFESCVFQGVFSPFCFTFFLVLVI